MQDPYQKTQSSSAVENSFKGSFEASRSNSGGGEFFEGTPRQISSQKRRRPIPPKLYRIGEVVDYSGVSRQTIHNYTTMGLLHESKWTAGGHRLYDENVFGRLDKISELKNKNTPLKDIREFFERLDEESA